MATNATVRKGHSKQKSINTEILGGNTLARRNVASLYFGATAAWKNFLEACFQTFQTDEETAIAHIVFKQSFSSSRLCLIERKVQQSVFEKTTGSKQHCEVEHANNRHVTYSCTIWTTIRVIYHNTVSVYESRWKRSIWKRSWKIQVWPTSRCRRTAVHVQVSPQLFRSLCDPCGCFLFLVSCFLFLVSCTICNCG